MQRSIVGFICTAFTAASTYFGLSNLLSVTTYRPAPLAQNINLVRAPPLERDAGFGHGMPTLQFAGSRIAQQARQAAVVGHRHETVLLQIFPSQLQAFLRRIEL